MNSSTCFVFLTIFAATVLGQNTTDTSTAPSTTTPPPQSAGTTTAAPPPPVSGAIDTSVPIEQINAIAGAWQSPLTADSNRRAINQAAADARHGIRDEKKAAKEDIRAQTGASGADKRAAMKTINDAAKAARIQVKEERNAARQAAPGRK